MALPAYDLERRQLYRRYLAALERYGQPDEASPSPGHAIRQCARCGRARVFRLDPEGNWYECTHCGHFA